MNVGEIKTSSQFLQRNENITFSAAARNREDTNASIALYQTIKENSEGQPNPEQTKQLVEQLNELLDPSFTDVKFEFHDKLERYYVTVVDQNTKEVIKEIPPKKMLDLYASIAESIGLIVDEKA
ncbi:flagellar protein FlaG [Paraliobacillus sp. PM-2]|uniref:flagellar protein FlaG n=1 Tax=Paraliobacillus sp. PM-2 TaxID=1462524 RepID=UPI00061BC3C8|nr:flagellar protein FlaG [Paraliobacillus sp. PM-2]CQR46405.1 flagellar protein FlaG [Paraliobacillus sp. PM-2]